MATQGPASTSLESRERRLTPDLVVRQAAAAGCAATIAGCLVGGILGRLAMSLLASRNPEDAGAVTDDGFTIGQVTASGILQLLGASTSMTMVGAAIYMMVRPLLPGTGKARVALASYGFGVTAAALVIHPGGTDFSLLEPLWLPIVLFVTLPMTLVAVFATLVERWLADDSWFLTAPRGRILPVLVVWLLGGVALILVLPAFAAALLLAANRKGDDERSSGPSVVRGIGRLALVVIAVAGTSNLISDVSTILA